MLSLAVVVGYEASILTEANTDSSPAFGRDQNDKLRQRCWAFVVLLGRKPVAYHP